jgi:hypothetical protein
MVLRALKDRGTGSMPTERDPRRERETVMREFLVLILLMACAFSLIALVALVPKLTGR